MPTNQFGNLTARYRLLSLVQMRSCAAGREVGFAVIPPHLDPSDPQSRLCLGDETPCRTHCRDTRDRTGG